MGRYKSTVTGTDVEDDFVVRCDDSLELFNGELSAGTAADLFDHGWIIPEFRSQESEFRRQEAEGRGLRLPNSAF